MVRIGIIGCGYWGPNLIRNLAKVEQCRVVAAADLDLIKLEHVQRLYPYLRTTTSAEKLLRSEEIDAIVIATPISTHYELAREALERGKHVLVEKPMVASVAEAEDLIERAAATDRALMVDHTFVYTGAVRKIREVIEAGELGEIYYYDAVRVNLGLFQHDVNVLWDLAPHDFSIMTHLISKNPVRVSAVGASPIRRSTWNMESIVYVTVEFGDGTLAHFHVNWLSPVKVRRTLIGGSRKIIIYDHLDQDNQVKVFDKGVDILDQADRYHALVQYRTGDMLAPKVDQTEALEVACRHFVECVLTKRQPLTNGLAGLRVVQLLAAAQHSLQTRGAVARV